MRKIALYVVLMIGWGSAAQASSYLDIYGVVHDPIQNVNGGNHIYSGPDLAPATILTLADLHSADLAGADLSSAVLSGADMSHADLSAANLISVSLGDVNLQGANLLGADLRHARFLGDILGSPFYDASTNFTNAWADYNTTPFDPVAAGWNLVPEPSTLLLLGMGLLGIGVRKKAESRCQSFLPAADERVSVREVRYSTSFSHRRSSALGLGLVGLRVR